MVPRYLRPNVHGVSMAIGKVGPDQLIYCNILSTVKFRGKLQGLNVKTVTSGAL